MNVDLLKIRNHKLFKMWCARNGGIAFVGRSETDKYFVVTLTEDELFKVTDVFLHKAQLHIHERTESDFLNLAKLLYYTQPIW